MHIIYGLCCDLRLPGLTTGRAPHCKTSDLIGRMRFGPGSLPMSPGVAGQVVLASGPSRSTAQSMCPAWLQLLCATASDLFTVRRARPDCGPETQRARSRAWGVPSRCCSRRVASADFLAGRPFATVVEGVLGACTRLAAMRDPSVQGRSSTYFVPDLGGLAQGKPRSPGLRYRACAGSEGRSRRASVSRRPCRACAHICLM